MKFPIPPWEGIPLRLGTTDVDKTYARNTSFRIADLLLVTFLYKTKFS